jgi:hypothetical protein
MIQLEHAEVNWLLNGHCKFQCSYCRPEWRAGTLDKTLDQYITIIEKLQSSRYKHHKKILWKLGGGEPLHFPHLSTILKKIKEKPAIVHLDTSGDDTWFSLFGVLNFIDKVNLTYHTWQNDDVFGFILEQCQEKNIGVSITIPLIPGQIYESKEKARQFRHQGFDCIEQVLREPNGDSYHGYSQVDINRIQGRDDNWMPKPVVFDPNRPDPNYVDLRVVNNTDPVYTGLPCYAGVDWLQINSKGFVSYSQCGGRNEHFNAFDPNWEPPSDHFPCTVNQCRNEQDRRLIRILHR